MKTLTNEQIIYLIDRVCCNDPEDTVCENCPLALECLHWFTGENCGSALDEEG